MSETELKTEKFLIGYIDLLGSKEKILSDKSNYWLNAVSKLYNDAWNRVNELEEFYPLEKPYIKVFSDNILIAEKVYTEDDDRLNSLFRILYFLSYIQSRALIDYQWLVRGAVVAGELYVTEPEDDQSKSFIWGQGLVNAHYIEDEVAVYPRIIVDKSVFEEYATAHLGYLFTRRKFAFDDVDSLCCLDFLSVYIDEEHSQNVRNIMKSALDSIHILSQKHQDNYKIVQKIAWTENYVKDVASDQAYYRKVRGRLRSSGRRIIRSGGTGL